MYGLEEDAVFNTRAMPVRIAVALAAYVFALWAVTATLDISLASYDTSYWYFVPHIVLLAFVFQAVDSTMGMGFGTAIAPLLIVMGLEPLEVVPMLLLAQFFSGVLAGWLHYDIGNVDFTLRPLNANMKALLLAIFTGVIATMASIYLVYWAIEVPSEGIEAYIALTIIAMGVMIFFKPSVSWRDTYRPRRLAGFALLGGISKGVAGGGYGPIITLGAIYAGIEEKSAVSIITLAEGMISLAGAAAFFALMWQGKAISFDLLPSVLTGSFLAAIISPFIVWLIPQRVFKYVLPGYAICIGLLILGKQFGAAG